MKNLEKEKNKNRKVLLICFLLFICVFPLVAQSSGDWGVLDSVGDKLINFLSSKFLKSILGLGLAGEFGAMAVAGSQGNNELVKKILPWAIGTGGVLGATAITNYIFDGLSVDEITAFNTVTSSLLHV